MSRTLKVIAGTAVCTFTAIALAVTLQDAGELRMAAMAVCFIAVIATAILAGRLAASLGALFSAIVFAVWLFPPIGSVTISEPHGLKGVIVFLLVSVTIASIAKPDPSRAERARWRA